MAEHVGKQGGREKEGEEQRREKMGGGWERMKIKREKKGQREEKRHGNDIFVPDILLSEIENLAFSFHKQSHLHT